MKLEDIIALAKQGYKPADIKELVALADTEPKEQPKEEPKEQPKEEPKEEPKEQPKEEPKHSAEVEELKKLILNQTEQLNASQKALEELQKGNTREDLLNSNDKQKTLNDIVRDFY